LKTLRFQGFFMLNRWFAQKNQRFLLTENKSSFSSQSVNPAFFIQSLHQNFGQHLRQNLRQTFFDVFYIVRILT